MPSLKPAICDHCGTALVNAGAPIWDDYCPNKDCTAAADDLRKFLTERRGELDKQKRLTQAAPDMLEALKLVDAYLFAMAPTSNERQIVADAIAKAESQ